MTPGCNCPCREGGCPLHDAMSDKSDWVAEARALCDAATPGPWDANGHLDDGHQEHERDWFVMRARASGAFGRVASVRKKGPGGGPDAAFIATARTALPRALTALEAADALAAAWEEFDSGGPMGTSNHVRRALAAYRKARE